MQFCAFKIGNTIDEFTFNSHFVSSFVFPDDLLLLAFLPVYYLRNFKKFKILCNSSIVYCSYPYFFVFMCLKFLRHSRVIMTYVNFLFLLICHITFFEIDWLFESYD